MKFSNSTQLIMYGNLNMTPFNFGRNRTVVFVCHITGSNNFFSAACARCRLTLTLLSFISKTSAVSVVLISPMSLSSKTIR